MTPRSRSALVVVMTVVTTAYMSSAPAAAQSAGTDKPSRTVDGQPDISGIYTFRTLTPLERPSGLKGQDTLTAESAAAYEAAQRTRLNRDLFDPEAGAPSAGRCTRGRRRCVVLQRVLVRARG